MADDQDLQQRLRASLEARASDVRPDPRTWTAVRERVTRGRRLRLALAGLTAAAVTVAAAVAVPALLDRSVVDLGPAEQPDALPGDTTQPAGEGPCGAPASVAGVVARREGLSALCVDGSTTMITHQRGDTNVAFHGSEIVFERQTPDAWAPVLVHYGLEPGQETVIGGGRLPALSTDGRLAWISDEPGDGRQPRILVAELFAEPTHEIPLAADDIEEFEVAALTWTADGQRLLVSAGYEGSVLWEVTLDGQVSAVSADADGAVYLAPAASGKSGFFTVLRGCCARTEGDQLTELALGLVPTRGGEFTKLVDPAAWPGGGLDPSGRLTVSYAGVSQPGDHPVGDDGPPSWVRGSEDGWVVSDGTRVYFARPDRVAVLYGEGFGHVWMNPAADPDAGGDADSGAAPPAPAAQPGLPEAVTTTRLRLYQAATARDWDALEAVMGPEFTSSFGFEPGPATGIAALRRMQERGQDPFDLLVTLLQMPHGEVVTESAGGTFYFWPRPFVKDPQDWNDEDLALLRRLGTEDEIADWRAFGGYIGYRVGIEADGTWQSFVAGD